MDENKDIKTLTDEELLKELNKYIPVLDDNLKIEEDKRTPQQKERIKSLRDYTVALQKEIFARKSNTDKNVKQDEK